jgi:hypothetical protein
MPRGRDPSSFFGRYLTSSQRVKLDLLGRHLINNQPFFFFFEQINNQP